MTFKMTSLGRDLRGPCAVSLCCRTSLTGALWEWQTMVGVEVGRWSMWKMCGKEEVKILGVEDRDVKLRVWGGIRCVRSVCGRTWWEGGGGWV